MTALGSPAAQVDRAAVLIGYTEKVRCCFKFVSCSMHYSSTHPLLFQQGLSVGPFGNANLVPPTA